jgi:hypothetical protein
VRLACVKADRARALGQVSTGAIPSAISRWLQLRRLISRMFWCAAALRPRLGRANRAGVPRPIPRLCRRFPRRRPAPARPCTRVGGDVSPVGLPTSPTIQRPGLTWIGHHRADEPTDQAVKGKPCPPSAVNASPTLPRPRSPSRPAQRAPFAPAVAILWPSLPSAPSSINGDPETRPPTFQQDFRKTQAPHPRTTPAESAKMRATAPIKFRS